MASTGARRQLVKGRIFIGRECTWFLMRGRRKTLSVLALDEISGERFEWIGGRTEGFECGEGVGDEFFGVFAGSVYPEDRWPSGFGAGGVFACGLAELF